MAKYMLEGGAGIALYVEVDERNVEKMNNDETFSCTCLDTGDTLNVNSWLFSNELFEEY